ncbi:hypothetical protein [Aquamicrobium defluvii]|uniref:Uncharacterized protein n=1 Tax=Aquamicrobium defluvii TaxID=69279 RepID=A0A4R6YI95_9HYPH|nr:hypothetical protein [Aquamicrobium defluvii]TDR36525.1 hypothetical protein DES43_105192 [Aquamicrobium defluvii]
MSDAKRFDDLPDDTKEFLTDLSPDDVRTIRAGLPIVRAIIGFGKVTKWIAIAALGILGGIVMLGESVAKIVAWFRP